MLLAWSAGAAVFRHLDEAGGAANAERRGRRRDLHVAGLGDGGGGEGHSALDDVEDAGVVLAAVLIDVGVDGDLRVGLEIEGGGVDEGDAERRIGAGLHHVVEIDVVLDLEWRGRALLRTTLAVAGHGGDVADRLFRRLLRSRWRVPWLPVRPVARARVALVPVRSGRSWPDGTCRRDVLAYCRPVAGTREGEQAQHHGNFQLDARNRAKRTRDR